MSIEKLFIFSDFHGVGDPNISLLEKEGAKNKLLELYGNSNNNFSLNKEFLLQTFEKYYEVYSKAINFFKQNSLEDFLNSFADDNSSFFFLGDYDSFFLIEKLKNHKKTKLFLYGNHEFSFLNNYKITSPYVIFRNYNNTIELYSDLLSKLSKKKINDNCFNNVIYFKEMDLFNYKFIFSHGLINRALKKLDNNNNNLFYDDLFHRVFSSKKEDVKRNIQEEVNYLSKKYTVAISGHDHFFNYYKNKNFILIKAPAFVEGNYLILKFDKNNKTFYFELKSIFKT